MSFQQDAFQHDAFQTGLPSASPIIYIGSQTDAYNGSPSNVHTFNIDLGTLAGDYAFIAFYGESNSIAPTAKLDGVSMTQQFFNPYQRGCGFYTIPVSTGGVKSLELTPGGGGGTLWDIIVAFGYLNGLNPVPVATDYFPFAGRGSDITFFDGSSGNGVGTQAVPSSGAAAVVLSGPGTITYDSVSVATQRMNQTFGAVISETGYFGDTATDGDPVAASSPNFEGDGGFMLAFELAVADTQTLGWQRPFLQPSQQGKISEAVRQNSFRSGRADADAAPQPTLGWLGRFSATPVKAVIAASVLATTAPAFVPRPADAQGLGWFNAFSLPKPQGKSLRLGDGFTWNAQASFSLAATPSDLGWLVAPPDPRRHARPINRDGGTAWAPQDIAPAIVAPPEFGWYAPFQPASAGAKAKQAATQPAWVPRAADVRDLGWHRPFALPRQQGRSTRLVDGFAWNTQATFSLTATPTQFGWHVAPAQTAQQRPARLGDGFTIGLAEQGAPAFGWYVPAPSIVGKSSVRTGNGFAISYAAAVQPNPMGWLVEAANGPARRAVFFPADGFALGLGFEAPVAAPDAGWLPVSADIKPRRPVVFPNDGFAIGLYPVTAPEQTPEQGWSRPFAAVSVQRHVKTATDGFSFVYKPADVAAPTLEWSVQWQNITITGVNVRLHVNAVRQPYTVTVVPGFVGIIYEAATGQQTRFHITGRHSGARVAGTAGHEIVIGSAGHEDATGLATRTAVAGQSDHRRTSGGKT